MKKQSEKICGKLAVLNVTKLSYDKALKILLNVEEKAWNSTSDDLSASSEKISNRIKVFPEGVSIAVINDGNDYSGVGSQYCFCFDWNGDLSSLTSWDDLTSKGNIEKVHDPSGNTGFLVGVGVIPEYRGIMFNHELRWKDKLKASELLIAITLETLFNKGVKQVIGNARIPFYHKRPDLSVEEYSQLRNDKGLLFDPVLRFHERMGAKVIKPTPYSMDDPESLNAGAWVLYSEKFKD